MKPLKANFILGKKQIILASLVLILGVAVYLNWQFANKNNDLDLTTALDETQSAQETQDAIENPDAIVDDTAAKLDTAAKVDEKVATGAKVDAKADTKAKTDAKVDEKAAPIAKVDAKAKTDAKVDVKLVDEKTAAATDAKLTAKPADAQTKGTTTKGKNLGDTLLVNSKSIADESYFAMAKLARTKSRDESMETIATVLNDTKLTDDDKKAVSAKAVTITDIIETESRIENLIKAKGFEECIVYITANNANVVVKTDGLDQDRATQIKNIIVSEGKIKGENVSITEIN